MFPDSPINDPLISDPLALVVVLAAVVLVALELEKRVTLFRSLGAALVGILIGMLLSNLEVIPGESPVYDFLQGTGVNIGIVLILTSVNVRSVVQAGPSMLAAFAIGALGTALGAMVAGLALVGQIGEETWKLTGQFTGTYTGGGVNYAALGRAFDTSNDLFTAALAADVILTAMWMAACLAVPVLLGKRKQEVARETTMADAPVTLERALYSSGRSVSLADAAALVVIAFGAVGVARALGERVPVLPEVLWLTSVALVAAQLPPVKRLSGGAIIGNYLVLLFLASNGAQSVIQNIVEIGPAVFYFACVTVAIHGIIIFGVGGS